MSNGSTHAYPLSFRLTIVEVLHVAGTGDFRSLSLARRDAMRHERAGSVWLGDMTAAAKPHG